MTISVFIYPVIKKAGGVVAIPPAFVNSQEY